MRNKVIISFVVILLVFVSGCISSTGKKQVPFFDNLGHYKFDYTKYAVAKIITHNEDKIKYVCSAFAIKKTRRTYWFTTSSHCVSGNIKGTNKSKIDVTKVELTIENRKTLNTETYYPKIIAIGNQLDSEDFAILEFETDTDIPLLIFSLRDMHIGDEIVNVNYPGFLGDKYKPGKIKKLHHLVDWKKHNVGVNWSDVILLSIPSYTHSLGTSGSPILHAPTGKVIGIVSGHAWEDNIDDVVVFSIDKFKMFLRKNGLYAVQ
ncbi:MAG: serine protease [bacterium]|nr:serine protease [bacterium]